MSLAGLRKMKGLVMFWDKEKIITAYEVPESVEGQPYIREPKNEDKDVKTMRLDRETGKFITLWQEKLLYPYKTTVSTTLCVVTTERKFTLPLLLDADVCNQYCWIWNGQNIPECFWSILGISKDSPQGLKASKWHDILLCKKREYLEILREDYPEMAVGEYRRLTTLIFRQLLKNLGVGTIKANIMGAAVGGWQFVSPQWWGVR